MKKETRRILAGGLEVSKGVAGALRKAVAILEGVLRGPPPKELRALLESVFSGKGLYLYVR